MEVTQEYFTVAEMAKRWRLSEVQVYRLIWSGELPAVRVGRSWRIADEAAARFMRDRATGAETAS